MALLKTNTGIGTTNPQAGLHVQGTMNVTGVSTFRDNVFLKDDIILSIGDNNDLLIYHPTTGTVGAGLNESYITSQNNNLNLETSSSGHIQIIKNGGGTLAKFDSNSGATELHCRNGTNDGKKFETISTGCTITGDLYFNSGSFISGNLSLIGSIDTQSSVSVGTTLSVGDDENFMSNNKYKISVKNSTFTTTPGITTAIDSFSGTSLDSPKTIEYTLKITNGSAFQAQKVLVMHNGSSAYSEQYGIMYSGYQIGLFDASFSGNNVVLNLTLGASVSGVIEYSFVKNALQY